MDGEILKVFRKNFIIFLARLRNLQMNFYYLKYNVFFIQIYLFKISSQKGLSRYVHAYIDLYFYHLKNLMAKFLMNI